MTTIPKGFRGDMPNGFDPARIALLDQAQARDIERRRRLLGPAYRLFYNDPLSVAHGRGVYLYDRNGDAYLDAYNNVVSLGHSHPRVVEAIQRQVATLSTHTRYLQDGLVDFAESLLKTFNGEIGAQGCAMFACTGSEANDLAMRIARHHTGRTGVIVTAEAYHGNSGVTAGFSPSLGRKSKLSPDVRTVPAPDSYRIPPGEIAQRMASDVARQIADLERHGFGFAAFIADSLFSSDGLYSYPTDVLGAVADVVRQAGGLFIADEVQSGFGRSGTHMWGHARHGVDPDIVTMGKPMGNGYPVAGIVVRRSVVEAFGNDMRYFNTFGGNTVAIAAAQAVLDTIHDEHLMANAVRIGALIADGIRGLAEKYEVIGDVRDAGLYFGVELVQDRESKRPDMDAALAVVNALRQRRVLISATGAEANVLKIRPPLVFTSDDAGRLIDALDASFADLK